MVLCVFVLVKFKVVVVRFVGLVERWGFCLMLRLRVSLALLKTSPSPISKSSKKSSFSCTGFRTDVGASAESLACSDCRFLSCSWNLMGPSGSTSPSSPSSSLSPVKALETLGLSAEAEELRADLPPRPLPAFLNPRLPSPHSKSKSSACCGVFGIGFLVESFNCPSVGSSRSSSILSTSGFFIMPMEAGVNNVGFWGDRDFATHGSLGHLQTHRHPHYRGRHPS